MPVETTKMSSRGQIVIPQDVRREIHATDGTMFAVIGNKDMIVLKKIETPSKENLIKELEIIAREGRRRLEKRGLNESYIHNVVQRNRRR
ncbi:MAG: hypothetical protein HY362_00135 [Candidatus Aenigmarchaeota archaeon]|nr:hypothetical protein [Candidatus Aenigmarchaeota archaeon]